MRHRLALVLTIAIATTACANSVDEFINCPSPDATVQAIAWVEAGGGAAGWVFYNVSLLPSGLAVDAERLDKSAIAFRASHAPDFYLRWIAPDTLEIWHGRIGTLYGSADRIDVVNRSIRIVHRQMDATTAGEVDKCSSGGRTTNGVERHLR